MICVDQVWLCKPVRSSEFLDSGLRFDIWIYIYIYIEESASSPSTDAMTVGLIF